MRLHVGKVSRVGTRPAAAGCALFITSERMHEDAANSIGPGHRRRLWRRLSCSSTTQHADGRDHRHLAAARPGCAARPAAVQHASRAAWCARRSTGRQHHRLHGAAHDRRAGQRHPGQPVPGRPHVPRLSSVRHPRRVAGHVGLPRRCAHERAVRRCRQLGPGARVFARQPCPRARRQPRLRLEHARRRDRHDDGQRPQRARHARGTVGGQLRSQARRPVLRRRHRPMARLCRRGSVRRERLARLLRWEARHIGGQGRPLDRRRRLLAQPAGRAQHTGRQRSGAAVYVRRRRRRAHAGPRRKTPAGRLHTPR